MTNALTPGCNTELIVALDFSDAQKADALLAELEGLPVIYKVGLELFLQAGPEWVKHWINKGRRVFLDLKFHDIPNTVAKACVQASRMGVEMLTLHTVGGRQMIDRIQEELANEAAKGHQKPKLLGVTVLTSFDDLGWSEVAQATGVESPSARHSVEGLVAKASEWGLDGIVCSPWEVSWVAENYPNLLSIVPGIRLDQKVVGDDQARTMTPKLAAERGASAIVVGRPIILAEHPRNTALRILGDLKC